MPATNPYIQTVGPRVVSGLSGWYDASDETSYTNVNGQISEWRDKSGLGNHITQNTANNRPTLFRSTSDTQVAQRATISGLQAIFFDGVNDRLVTSNAVTSQQSRTVFAVTQLSSETITGALATFGDTNPGGNLRWLCRYPSITVRVVGGDSVQTNQFSALFVSHVTPNVVCWSQNGATRNLSFLRNNTPYAVTGNPPNNQTVFSGLTVGCVVAGASIQEFFNGTLGELLIYNRELSSNERNDIARSLAAKWKLTIA